MFKNMKKFVGLNKEDRKLMTLGIGIGMVVWCVMAAVYTGIVCAIIYFVFWCVEHFGVIS